MPVPEPDSPFPLQRIREALRPSIQALQTMPAGGETPEQWLAAMYKTFDAISYVGCPAEVSLDRMAKHACALQDDGFFGPIRESMKQAMVSALLAREFGWDPVAILEDRWP